MQGSSIIPLSQQMEQFATVQRNISARISQGAAGAVLSRSLFLLSTGGNDLFAFFARNSTPSDGDARRFVANLVSLYQNHVKVGRSPPSQHDPPEKITPAKTKNVRPRRGGFQALYVLGARKFAVIDVPPIGCCPYPRSLHPLGACIDALNELARGFNKGLRDAMRGLGSSFQGLKYSVGSSHAVVQSIMKHPQRLGTCLYR